MLCYSKFQQIDDVYLSMLELLTVSEKVTTRNSTVHRIMGLTATFQETPLISIRKTAWKTALREWEWFMSGSSNIKDLHPSVKSWWEPWANEAGEIPNNYSKQLRKFENSKGQFDQIEFLIKGIKEHPYSRRNILTTWNSADMADSETPITNCHNSLTFFYVEDNKLSLHTTQRSADMLLGVPHNWIQEWAFLMYMAHRTGFEVGEVIWVGLDCHLYENHIDFAKEMFNNWDEIDYLVPNHLVYTPSSEEFKADDFSLSMEYNPIINKRAPMTV